MEQAKSALAAAASRKEAALEEAIEKEAAVKEAQNALELAKVGRKTGRGGGGDGGGGRLAGASPVARPRVPETGTGTDDGRVAAGGDGAPGGGRPPRRAPAAGGAD